jgi:predicted pyridoxine 5'-phosphate oxidase superfamily flavin-nucleotide-binding protein
MIITDDIREFLQEPRTARISTIDPQGFPHTVPVWFALDGDSLVVISDRDTRKVDHIRANPKGAAQVGGDPGDGGGYLLKGLWSIEPDPGGRWLRQMTLRYEEGEEAERDIAAWAELDMIVLRLTPQVVKKVI